MTSRSSSPEEPNGFGYLSNACPADERFYHGAAVLRAVAREYRSHASDLSCGEARF